MAITSIKFLEFCLCTILLFIVFPPRFRWVSLLISSIAFYWISGGMIIGFIIATSFLMWIAGLILDKQKRSLEEKLKDADKAQKKALKKKAERVRRATLIIFLIFSIGVLIVFKIFNLFTGAFLAVVGLFAGGESLDAISLIIPLGISYYTFAVVGYVLDIYWKRYECEKNFFRFFLFAIYYPHILQGPISRYTQLGAELKKPKLHFTWNNFVVGMESILLGCFKKLVIADRVSIFVSNTMFNTELAGSAYLLALVLDAIQIYTDFSGYMDIVRGISLMFDVKLEENFNHPFFARSVPEFWRRWHMSLGGWFKDYVYYPLTLSKVVKKINKKAKNWKNVSLKSLVGIIIPVMCTWILTGLWHGSGIGYLCWGLYYGTLIALSVTFSDGVDRVKNKLHINSNFFLYRVFQTIKIFVIFMGGRFLGSTMDFTQRWNIIKNIFTSFNQFELLTTYGIGVNDFIIVGAGMVFLIIIGIIENKENIFVWFNRKNKIFCAIVLYILVFVVFLLGIYGAGFSTAGFMYQQY